MINRFTAIRHLPPCLIVLFCVCGFTYTQARTSSQCDSLARTLIIENYRSPKFLEAYTLFQQSPCKQSSEYKLMGQIAAAKKLRLENKPTEAEAQLTPDNPEFAKSPWLGYAYFLKGQLNIALKKLNVATPYLQKAEKYTADMHSIHVQYLYCYLCICTRTISPEMGAKYYALAEAEQRSVPPAYRGLSLYIMGHMYLISQEHNKAETKYKEALKLLNPNVDKDEFAGANGNLGKIYSYKGKYPEALQAFLFAAQKLEETNDYNNLGLTHQNITTLFYMLENYEDAKSYNNKAVDAFLKAGNLVELAGTYANRGVLAEEDGEYDLAKDSYRNALAIYEPLGAVHELGTIYNDMAGIFYHYEVYDSAEYYNKKALEYHRKNKAIDSEVDVLFNLALIYKYTNREELAAEKFLQALTLVDSIAPYTEQHIPLLDELRKYYAKQKNMEKFMFYNDRYITVKDSLFSVEATRNVEEIKTAYETEQKERKIAELQLYAIINQNENKLLKRQKRISELELQGQITQNEWDNKRSAAEKEKLQNEKEKEAQLRKIAELESENQSNIAQKNENRMVLSIAIFLLVVASVVSLWYFRDKRHKAEYATRLAEEENKTLRARMNPHFISNSVDAIRYYIRANKPELADQYIIRLSELTRDILAHSGQSVIPLGDELHTLALYMDLERERFEYQFDYHIETDPGIDLATTEFPSMILQPFAENAVKHAFSGSVKKGALTVSIHRHEDKLQITVRDNGSGTEKTADDRPSFGLSLTQKHIENYASLYRVEAEFSIRPSPEGTEIRFWLPYQTIH